MNPISAYFSFTDHLEPKFAYSGQAAALFSWPKSAFILYIRAELLAYNTVSVRRLRDTDKSALSMITKLFAGHVAFIVLRIFLSAIRYRSDLLKIIKFSIISTA